ncbi:tripartite tricarboxylate transporter TctB family protein [Yoonia vestfoldensis]|jgi:hypothetical protein|uniref:Uncharacterized protein n=1 Tax=Yoonia vestfoldensis TaxID=245188 RepID=A0A1Y0EE87_9RHOB|nr:tripartite tricarboxylate transporter TctB family protein [Yoonia vestfoldensis]ARU01956.1 hypothetical protein LOKVESSMR4R_02661 [Yoonia vestfoldensis]
MRDQQNDIERIIAAIGAPPDAPLAMPRQDLEQPRAQPQPGLFPRLIGVFMPKAGP